MRRDCPRYVEAPTIAPMETLSRRGRGCRRALLVRDRYSMRLPFDDRRTCTNRGRIGIDRRDRGKIALDTEADCRLNIDNTGHICFHGQGALH